MKGIYKITAKSTSFVGETFLEKIHSHTSHAHCAEEIRLRSMNVNYQALDFTEKVFGLWQLVFGLIY